MRALLFVVALTGTAYAQAPGEVVPQPPQEQTSSVMDRRWGVSASLGTLGLKPDRDDADNVPFSMLELAGRFRIIPSIEVGLSLQAGGAMKGDFNTGGLFIDGRYRFLAERPWNVFALLSIGVMAVSGEDASEEAKKGRGAIRLGVGVERRFRALAIHAELRLVGVGENEDFEPMPTDTTLKSELANSKLNGGSLTIGGTFYF